MVPAAFVQLEQMPLTANGKLDRSALLALQPESPTACGDQVSPRSPVEKIVAETWQQVLGVERVGIYDNFFALGGDSILSLQIVSRLNQAGLTITPPDLFHHPTVAQLSAALEHTPTAVPAESGPVSGPVPLTSIQHWFFEQQFADAHHWNQAVMFEVREALDRAALKRAISWLLEQHDALRLRFVRQGDGWQQFNAEHEGDTPLTIVELNGLSEADQRRTIELAASEWQTSLNLSEGPLIRAVYFEADSANARRLLLIIHHLAVDAVSWRILFEELERAYGQAASGLEIAFARKTTSFKQWAERLQAYSGGGDARAEYWLSDRWLKADPLPVDLDPRSNGEATATPNSEASANTVRIDFEVEETDALLHKTAQVFRTRVVEVLLAALGRALWRWYGARFVLLDVESHGRESMFEGIDVSRTVGWFTTIYPVLLETAGADGDEVKVLKSVKEQLRQVPHHGIGYGALRARPRAQVLFNYLGQLDRGLPEHAVFKISADSVGPVHSPRAQRSHLLEINSYIAGGRLRVEWQYSEDIHRRVTIERLSESFKNSLRALLAHTQSPGVFELTPADFPMVQLSSEQLEGALAEVTFDD
jgi:non-ribosomal peptide synthase protein (TIGR01720 family)